MSSAVIGASLAATVTAGAAALGIPALPAAQAATAATAAPATVFVANVTGCSDSGPGTMRQPFCTIGGAAVQPGQTAMVESSYPGNVTISQSGTATAPIRFVFPGGMTVQDNAGEAAVTVQNASHVIIQKLIALGGSGGEAIVVSDSSHITIDRGVAIGGLAGVQITGSSSAVTISQETVRSVTGTAVQIRLRRLRHCAQRRQHPPQQARIRRPGTSTLNFTSGATVPNLAMLAGPLMSVYNGSAGTVQIVVDEAGYFITPPS